MSRRTQVVLVHHPPVDDRIRLRVLRNGHVRVHRRLRTAAGALDAFAAGSAALDRADPAVRAGFNAYAIEDDGRVTSVEAHVIAADGHTLIRMPLLEAGETE